MGWSQYSNTNWTNWLDQSPSLPHCQLKRRGGLFSITFCLEVVGLNPDQVLTKFLHELSGGQLQRLLIARALLLDVQFLVADEVISMFDALTRIEVLNLLADLKARGLPILFITHDLSVGYYISAKAVILYRGCVAEMSSTEKTYFNPLHSYRKILMAAAPRLDKKWEEVERDHFVACSKL
jgi:peptide/nickel transport system ATP-binding protein